MLKYVPIVIMPVTTPQMSELICLAVRCARTISRSGAIIVCPFAVGTTPFFERTTSGKPTSSSREAIIRVTPDCE